MRVRGPPRLPCVKPPAHELVVAVPGQLLNQLAGQDHFVLADILCIPAFLMLEEASLQGVTMLAAVG